jgi:hypothetical protein
MLPWNPSLWTEQYLLSLVGQPESGRLEFKSGKALGSKKDKDTFVREQLSPAVSAFANSEGGVIVIGMEETRVNKGEPRVASKLDGIAIGPGNAIESPEQLQQLVDSCISPFLTGLAMRRVQLSGHLEGRVAVVVHVPQGSTAYQARDHLYYSRSEFETKSMPDHEVRLRMMRGRVAQAKVEVSSCHSTPGYDDVFQFTLAVVNTGELTIREFVLVIRNLNCDELTELRPRAAENLVDSGTRDIGSETRIQGPDRMLFPGDSVELGYPHDTWYLPVPIGTGLPVDSRLIEWTIYLDDATPSKGTIDLIWEIHNRTETVNVLPC